MLPSRKLTCPLKRDQFNRKYIFQPLIFRGYVSCRGCTLWYYRRYLDDGCNYFKFYSYLRKGSYNILRRFFNRKSNRDMNLYGGCGPLPVTVANTVKVYRNPLLKMFHNPGGDWHPVRGPLTIYTTLSDYMSPFGVI